MKRTVLACLALLAVAGHPVMAGGGLYGKVITRDGRTLTGALRWDRNEAYWDQILSGTKEQEVRIERPEEDRSFRFLGLRLPGWGDSETVIRHSFAVPMGHVAAIAPDGPGWAHITLKSGEIVHVQGGSTDLGRGLRGLEISPDDGAPLTLQWDDLKRVEFAPTPAGDRRDADRIYGEVVSRGGSFTGWVAWDRDETRLDEELDGEADGVDREVPFADIAVIERVHSRASRVTLVSGGVLEMSGTNDVNDDNRGIEITTTGLLRVLVPWQEFVRFERQPAPASPTYDSFDGGRRLRGRVLTDSAASHEGLITWDRDETWSWETLDGDSGALSYAIPFDQISAILRHTRHGSVVELKDGRRLELEGSNDVDENNQGVLVAGENGHEQLVLWDAFQELRLQP